MALIHLTDKIRSEINNSSCTFGTFRDFPKAFDVVNYHVLLKKLK